MNQDRLHGVLKNQATPDSVAWILPPIPLPLEKLAAGFGRITASRATGKRMHLPVLVYSGESKENLRTDGEEGGHRNCLMRLARD